jgi:tetratricopeptide (TPR) repeat protein
MLTLCLRQGDRQGDAYPIAFELEEPGFARQTASANVTPGLDAQDAESLRWYLEDYLRYPFDPAPQIAVRVEARLAEIGRGLFHQLFDTDEGTRRLWGKMADRLNDCRIEITTGVQEATALPWELLRDPLTDAPLALGAAAFVRSQTETTRRMAVPQLERGQPIRILLAICRPGGGDDVPFRSVARRLLESLTGEAAALFELDVLRPPSFAQLAKTLRAAKTAGKPYHILHFDGHGAYDAAAEGGGGGFRPSALLYADNRPGKHGHLLFENPALPGSIEYVPGPALGDLLVETGVPVLVLNACRSAHAEAQSPVPGPQSPTSDTHSQVRAFGSLAQEVVDAGVPGVIAMRYNVYVVTAAQYVADLYAALARGDPLGEAATYARKQLAAQPIRHVIGDPIALQDWPVPVVYEAAALALFPHARPGAVPRIVVGGRGVVATPDGAGARVGRGGETPSLQDVPPPPDIGFWGRDETLLALDRAFDGQHVALVHGYAGSGKTATAAEFARWYAATGGLPHGAVLFTSFEQPLTLARALDAFGALFDPLLQKSGIHWLALTDAERRDIALQVVRQIPVLWIWDNVEPVAGFPAGTPSRWSAAEQAELADFLRAAAGTRARFLLTSRRDERGWLGDLPRRIALPPMPREERILMAQKLAERHGVRLDVPAWQPLLDFSGGNPLTITVVVGQALREGRKTKDEIAAFVAQLRAGAAVIQDEEREGRTRSLAASLSYGFAAAFTDPERRILALLHLFQGFVDVKALRIMVGDPTILPVRQDWCLPEPANLQPSTFTALLDRAAEAGLLTARGGGYYTIHPALPWFFRELFEREYPDGRRRTDDEGASVRPSSSVVGRAAATRAFVEDLGELGSYYHNEYEAGNRDVIAALRAEEANLLHARGLARRHGWWLALMKAMQGLRMLYDHTGRRAAWAALVAEIVPDLVDAATGGPRPGREAQWGLVTEYRVRLAQEGRDWPAAERMQRTCVEWERKNAAPWLAGGGGTPSVPTDKAGRNAVRTLGVSLHELGQILREQGKSECAQAYEEVVRLDHLIGDRAAEAVAAFNLGRAYTDLPVLRDLDAAERWYRRSLELRDPRDRLGRSKTIDEIGMVIHEKFREARNSKASNEKLLDLANGALRAYQQALELAPPDALNKLGLSHQHIGSIYTDVGDIERAIPQFNEAIRYFEAEDNQHEAGRTRRNVAVTLAERGRFDEALLYARAALRNYESFAGRAAADEQDTRGLIEWIEGARRGG